MSNPDGPSAVVEELDRQLARLAAYTHTGLGHAALRDHDLERLVYGLLELLLAKGVVSAEEVESAARAIGDEMAARGDIPTKMVALRVDPPSQSAVTRVDCSERMPICKAICCKLDFALTSSEVEAGRVKWDLGRPYYIRHDASGFCHHNDRSSGGCGVYAERPAICKTYSCANDRRIWKDFERRELNVEWLEKNLASADRPRLLRVLMQRDLAVEAPPRGEAPPATAKDAGPPGTTTP